MADKTNAFSITSATLTIGSNTYCATNLSLSYTAEPIEFLCMSATTPTVFDGVEKWSGSCTLAYDTAGMDDLWGARASLSFAVTKSTTGTITFATAVGSFIVITDVSANFAKTEVPQVNITFVGSGTLTETVA